MLYIATYEYTTLNPQDGRMDVIQTNRIVAADNEKELAEGVNKFFETAKITAKLIKIQALNKKAMKLKDLLFNREKLRKYDDLTESIKALKKVQADNGAPYDSVSYPYQLFVDARNGKRTQITFTMQPFMLQLFIDALEAEIKKLDEE